MPSGSFGRSADSFRRGQHVGVVVDGDDVVEPVDQCLGNQSGTGADVQQATPTPGPGRSDLVQGLGDVFRDAGAELTVVAGGSSEQTHVFTSREVLDVAQRSRWFLALGYLSPPRCYGRVYDALGLHESGC
ncbi:hypothetical protein [Streptomyces sp. NPDC051132]|uniref:hypothetical protein n=1 Tax=unclassified Streptomyces TaxID=2593676 RepID=UPI00344AC5D6